MNSKADLQIIISKTLKQLRQEREITIRELSEITSIATSTISSYENSARNMSVDTIVKILSAYNIQPLIFFEKCIAKLQQIEE